MDVVRYTDLYSALCTRCAWRQRRGGCSHRRWQPDVPLYSPADATQLCTNEHGDCERRLVILLYHYRLGIPPMGGLQLALVRCMQLPVCQRQIRTAAELVQLARTNMQAETWNSQHLPAPTFVAL